MKLAIGIITYQNSSEELALFSRGFYLAQKTLFEENPTEHQISLFFIDNGSTPTDLKKWIPEAYSLPSQGNVGYTRAMNRILEHVFLPSENYDALITANPDGCFHHHSLLHYVKWMKKEPRALLEARQFPEEHAKIYHPTTHETPWSSGCSILISKELYSTLGPLDEEFFMYMEDVDYSWRARAQGFKTLLCPDVLYFHGVVDRKESDRTVIQFYLSSRYLAWKWGHVRFLRWTERILLTRKGFTRETLPALKGKKGALSHWSHVTCFERVFAFADCRW